MFFERQQDQFLISTDKQKLDLDVIYGFLITLYWATGIPQVFVERSIEHALNIGVYILNSEDGREQQVGFACIVTDYHPVRSRELCGGK